MTEYNKLIRTMEIAWLQLTTKQALAFIQSKQFELFAVYDNSESLLESKEAVQECIDNKTAICMELKFQNIGNKNEVK